MEELLAAAASDQDRGIFAVAAFAGLRMGELRALRWSDIDPRLCAIHVRRSYVMGRFEAPKSGRVRSVPLIEQAARRLVALRSHGDGLVFVNGAGNVIDDSRLRKRFHETLDRAGLPPMRFHDLRHSFGTLAVQAFPLSDVAAYMGHAHIGTTMLYVHHVPKTDAAARLSSVVTSGSAADQRATASPQGAWARFASL